MNKSLWEKNYAEVRQALQEMEKEYQNWQKVFRKYFYIGPFVEGKPIPGPERLIDEAGMREMEGAYQKYEKARDNFNKAWLKLREAQRR